MPEEIFEIKKMSEKPLELNELVEKAMKIWINSNSQNWNYEPIEAYNGNLN